MNVRMLAAGLLATVPMAAAWAADKPKSYRYTVDTVAAARSQGAVTASGIRWNCSGSRCTTTGPWAVPGVGACKALAEKVGAVRSYGHPGRQLDKAQLRQCNGAAATAGTEAGKPARSGAGGTSTASGSARTGATMGAVQGPRLPGGNISQRMALRKEHYANLERTIARAKAEAARRSREEAARHPLTTRGTDCDDGRADVHPGAPEICDRRDNNCNGEVDEGLTLRRYFDADGDGHGDAARALDACPADVTAAAQNAEATGSGWLVEIGNDCDDADPGRWRDCR